MVRTSSFMGKADGACCADGPGSGAAWAGTASAAKASPSACLEKERLKATRIVIDFPFSGSDPQQCRARKPLPQKGKLSNIATGLKPIKCRPRLALRNKIALRHKKVYTYKLSVIP
ncbi:MAG: hypothetical protein IT550_06790 [Novosphingobium sp.]|nr:hypothetical protein [Novosphingobium sp.]